LIGGTSLSSFRLEPVAAVVERIARCRSEGNKQKWLVEFSNGDKLTGTLDPEKAELVTAFGAVRLFRSLSELGELEIPAGSVSSVGRVPDDDTWRVGFRNGDRLTGQLDLKTLNVIADFGDLSIVTEQVENISLFRRTRAGERYSPEGLVAYYPFDGSPEDRSGGGSDGKVHGAVLTEDRSGRPRSAYLFDGNDYIDIGDNPQIMSDAFTVTAWIRPQNVGGWRTVLSYQKGSHAVHVQRGRLHYGWQWVFAPVVQGERSLQVGDWVFVGVTRDSDGHVSLYVDGQPDGSAAVQIESSFERHALIGGDVVDGEYFHGEIDDLMIFDRALAGTEVRELYESQK
jgi:hypothetical protein